MDILELIFAALRLDSGAFARVIDQPNGLALSIVFVAGLSSAVGNSFVLFASRVPPRRFIASLVFSAALFVSVYFFWTASIWLVAWYVWDAERMISTAAKAVGLAYAPQLFTFLILVPYFGSGIGVLLSTWNLLAIVVATQVVFDLTLAQSVVSSAAGWLILQLAQRTVGWPVARLARWARTAVAGRRLEGLDELLEHSRDGR